MTGRFARSLVVGGVVAALLVAAVGPALASARCFVPAACCPCGQSKQPAVPTAQSSCCCVARDPAAPTAPAPVPLPPTAAPTELAAPFVAVLPDPFRATVAASPPAEPRLTGPDPPPVWLLTTSFRR